MKRLHSLLVVLLLLAYAGTATSIMPAVFAALAVLDGSHRVMICQTEQGTQVRLHHRENDFTPEVCDHTGLLAKLIVSFCLPAAEGDHSLSTNEVTGMLTSSSDEAKRFIKDKQDCNLEAVDFNDPQARLTQGVFFKTALRDFHVSRGMALREIATIRLLI